MRHMVEIQTTFRGKRVSMDKCWLLVPLLCFLTACASTKLAPTPKQEDLLRDDWYPQPSGLQSALVQEEVLFALPADLAARLDSARREIPSKADRLNFLFHELFGSDLAGFDYQATSTTPPAETYARKKGDCISLALLAAAIAERLGFAAQIQEVGIPLNWQRIRGRDFVNRHVNVAVRRPASVMVLGGIQQGDNLVIDFDPATPRRPLASRPLSRDEVLTAFDNNLAAEALTRNDDLLAYAYLRRALRRTAGFTPALSNLAALYQQRGTIESYRQAEKVLLKALEHDPDSYVVLQQQALLYSGLGRLTEAASVQKKLDTLRVQDPHRRYAEALDAFEREDYARAKILLEQALEVASGYTELHTLLSRVHLATVSPQGLSQESALTWVKDHHEKSFSKRIPSKLSAMR